jgi:hypothetical protein
MESISSGRARRLERNRDSSIIRVPSLDPRRNERDRLRCFDDPSDLRNILRDFLMSLSDEFIVLQQ